MLTVVEQEDHRNTFGESKEEAWDKLCKTGKLIKQVFVGEEVKTSAPPPSTGPSDAIISQDDINKHLQVEHIRDVIKRKKPEEIQLQSGVDVKTLPGQADTRYQQLYPLPQQPLNKELRPQKKECMPGEERPRRTR